MAKSNFAPKLIVFSDRVRERKVKRDRWQLPDQNVQDEEAVTGRAAFRQRERERKGAVADLGTSAVGTDSVREHRRDSS